MSSIKETATELKVRAAALAALAGGVVINGILAGTVTDFIEKLPDALEVGALSLAQAAGVYVTGYVTKNVAGKLAPSTIDAVNEWLRRHKPGSVS